MGYMVDKEEWLRGEVVGIRGLTYAIDATDQGDRISRHLQEITTTAQRARRRLIRLGLDRAAESEGRLDNDKG